MFFIGKLNFFFSCAWILKKKGVSVYRFWWKYWRLLNWNSLAGRQQWCEVITCTLKLSGQNFVARATFKESCPTIKIKMMIYRKLQCLFQLVALNFLCITEHFLNVWFKPFCVWHLLVVFLLRAARHCWEVIGSVGCEIPFPQWLLKPQAPSPSCKRKISKLWSEHQIDAIFCIWLTSQS